MDGQEGNQFSDGSSDEWLNGCSEVRSRRWSVFKRVFRETVKGVFWWSGEWSVLRRVVRGVVKGVFRGVVMSGVSVQTGCQMCGLWDDQKCGQEGGRCSDLSSEVWLNSCS